MIYHHWSNAFKELESPINDHSGATRLRSDGYSGNNLVKPSAHSSHMKTCEKWKPMVKSCNLFLKIETNFLSIKIYAPPPHQGITNKSDEPPKELSKYIDNWILKFKRTFWESLSHKLCFTSIRVWMYSKWFAFLWSKRKKNVKMVSRKFALMSGVWVSNL